ncbi:chondroitin lyase [candidate division KSB1 bacterium]|nr:chondroitin lyase [candidate division KSB1 bacterium]
MTKKRILISFIIFALSATLMAADHPSMFITKEEAQAINNALGKYPILDQSFEKMKNMVDAALAKPMEVPQPGEAGGYEHERHKQNYRAMQAAGILFTITGDEKYAAFIRDMLLKYADMYPNLGPHPMAKKQAPGMLFHQMLNETVWLTYTSQAYDCIYDWLDQSTRENIEENVFQVIIDWFIERNHHEFDRIHNHGTWSVCSIGLIGYVLGNQDLVDMALYGTKKDGSGGFLKQLDLLFSPDGYYMEGPYYVRYALRPFFHFAEAIHRNQPELKIYEYRDQILKKAYYSAVQTTFPNGVFPPINDASRTMDIRAPGIVLGNALVFDHYGADVNLLGLAKIQKEVVLNRSGLKLARAYAERDNIPDSDWGSIEFTDGHDGEQGGLGILRMGTGEDQTMLLMKYGVHGEGHGHFDKLHFILYDHGNEVIPDYGFCRWINIEPKFGGRYLPENDSYAKQTIAHNTVVVDRITQNKSNRKRADKVAGKRHFFDGSGENVKIMSARADDYYPGVKMQRTMLLVKDDRMEYPTVIDIYRLESEESHTYDFPVHFRGQLITTNFDYQTNVSVQKQVGDDFGYQHIWEEATASTDETLKFTWLDGHHYYSLVQEVSPETEIIFGRTGANDPNFNLRSEPMIIIRDDAQDKVFASVFEVHGYFDEASEKSMNARGSITDVNVIGSNAEATVIEVMGNDDIYWRICVNNAGASDSKENVVKFGGETFKWTGNYKVDLNVE